MNIPIALFQSTTSKTPQAHTLPWPELRQKLQRHVSATVDVQDLEDMARLDQVKRRQRCFSPVTYTPGATRGNAGVQSVHCYIADIDDGTPIEALRERWQGWAWCLYSTFKSRASILRYRVVFPLSRPVAREDWQRTWRKLTYHLTDNHCDPSTKDPARLHLLPASPKDWLPEAFADFQEGDFLDPDAFDDPPPDPQEMEREAARARRSQAWETPTGACGGDGREGERPGEAFNRQASQESVLDLLIGAGWEEAGRRGDLVYLRRPGKSEGHSGLLGSAGGGGSDHDPTFFYCFSSSAPPLEGGRGYDPFGLFAALHHGSDYSVAARDLGSRGFGESADHFEQRRKRERGDKEMFRRQVEMQETIRRAEPTGVSPASSRNGLPLADRRRGDEKTFNDFQKTDAGNAEVLVWREGENARYCGALGWRVFNGAHWEPGDEKMVRLARQTARAMLGHASALLKQAQGTEGDTERKRLVAEAENLMRHAIRSESAPRLRAMVDLAASFVEVEARAEDFDLRPWLVPFQNGVWDRGEFRPPLRQDMTERLLPVAYSPKADPSEWLALLDRITGGDNDFAKTLQDVAGYCLSGASTLRLLPWLYGPKGTGKSTFADLLASALGELGHAPDVSLVTGQREEEHLGAAVRGRRALFLPEAGNRRLDSEILKRLSGGDRIPGRYRYAKDTFNALPTWALLVTSNDPPNMSAHDEALKDRLIALPFVHRLDEGAGAGGRLTFTGGRRLEEVRRDPQSPLLAGFVAWAVEGLSRVFAAQEVYRAPVAQEHTRRFWADTDPLTPFWQSVSEESLRKGMPAEGLRGLYASWCDAEGIRRPQVGRAWGKACRAVGLEDRKGTGGARFWYLPSNVPWLVDDNAVVDSGGVADFEPFSGKSLMKSEDRDFYQKQGEIRHSATIDPEGDGYEEFAL